MNDAKTDRLKTSVYYRSARYLAKSILPIVVVFFAIFVAWAIMFRLNLWPQYLFPSPLQVLDKLVILWNQGSLVRGISVTIQRLLMAFSMSLMLGIALAFLMANFPTLGRGTQPYILGLQTLPSIAWVPLSILWFGYSESALLFVTIVGSVFSITISFTDAIKTVSPTYIRAARNMGCDGIELLYRVSIPASLPNLISGTKHGWSFAWRSLLGAEIIFATAGLGFLLNVGREFLDISQVIAMMVTILFLGILFERIIFNRIQEWVSRRWGLSPHI